MLFALSFLFSMLFIVSACACDEDKTQMDGDGVNRHIFAIGIGSYYFLSIVLNMFWRILLWNWVESITEVKPSWHPPHRSKLQTVKNHLPSRQGMSVLCFHVKLSFAYSSTMCGVLPKLIVHTWWYRHCCDWLQVAKEWSLQVNKTRLKQEWH